MGTAVFGAYFTARLAERLNDVFTNSGLDASQAADATATIDPKTLSTLPEHVQDGIVAAYADSLAPVFWYVIPFLVLALLFAFFLKEIPLETESGLVARGEAIGGEEAERLEAERRVGTEQRAGARIASSNAEDDKKLST